MFDLDQYTVTYEVEQRADGTALVGAQLTEVPGCIAQGPSEVEALARLRAILPAYLESQMRNGFTPPEPTSKSISVARARFGDPSIQPSWTGEFQVA